MDNNKDGKTIAVVKNLESSIENQACLMNVQISHSKREMIDIEDDKRRKDKRENEKEKLQNMIDSINKVFQSEEYKYMALGSFSGNEKVLLDTLTDILRQLMSYDKWLEKENEKEDYYESLDDDHRDYINGKLDVKINECADRSHGIESLLIKFKD